MEAPLKTRWYFFLAMSLVFWLQATLTVSGVQIIMPVPASAPGSAPGPALTPPAPATNPSSAPESERREVQVPLNYEVVESYIEEETITERHRLEIEGEVVRDELVEKKIPVGYVTVQNKDNVSGTFELQLSFYAVNKRIAELHQEIYGRFRKDILKRMGEEYTRKEKLELDPSEKGTAKYRVRDINTEEAEWFWEFEVTPSTKTVPVEEEPRHKGQN